jgi:hypothetical protein
MTALKQHYELIKRGDPVDHWGCIKWGVLKLTEESRPCKAALEMISYLVRLA